MMQRPTAAAATAAAATNAAAGGNSHDVLTPAHETQADGGRQLWTADVLPAIPFPFVHFTLALHMQLRACSRPCYK